MILRFLRAKNRRRRKADFSWIRGIKVSLTSIKMPIFLIKPPKIGPWTPAREGRTRFWRHQNLQNYV